jgi:hypothetical protein
MIDNVDSSRDHSGQRFEARVDEPVVVGGRTVISRGASARLVMTNVAQAGHIEGRSEVSLELVSISINGASYPVRSNLFAKQGASRGKRSAAVIGGGAAVGAAIGGIFGHKKGAAAGAAAGAGGGTAAQMATKGQAVTIPSETRIEFTLRTPISVPGDARGHGVRPSVVTADNGVVNRIHALLIVPLVAAQLSSAANLTPETSRAFDHYVELAEARMNADLARDRFLGISGKPEVKSKLRSGQVSIERGVTLDNGNKIDVSGGMIQDWVGTMFIPGAVIPQVKGVLQDYENYRSYYKPDVIESKQIAHQGDEYDVFLRLYKKQALTVVLNTNYHVRYGTLDPQRMYVI